MVETSVFFLWIFLFNFPSIQAVDSTNAPDEIRLNTTSGRFRGKEILIETISIQQFFGIPYGEKPERFQKSTLRKHDPRPVIQATNRTSACIQSSGGLSYGPFDLPDMYDEDCLTLNIFRPTIPSSFAEPKAIMVFCHGGSNQVGSGSLFDGSAVAAIGDVIVITINYRLNILGFLTPSTDILSGNYGLHDQLLALKWISLNAESFHGDATRITYVGHSAGAANAMLLAMSKYSNGLIARVIAQSGCPLNQWAIDRNPHVRFGHVLEANGLKSKEMFLRENLQRLTNFSANNFQYKNQSAFDILPEYPFPVIDDDLIASDIEETIRTGSLTNIDILIGVTADESLYFAKEHIFNHYLPKKYRSKYSSFSAYSSSKLRKNSTRASVLAQMNLYSYLKKSQYIKKYLQTNYPEYVCFIEEIHARFSPEKLQQQNLTAIVQGYSNLVSDLMFYYDLVRFLHQRLESNTSAATYVYYYTNPPTFHFEHFYRRIPNTVGHFAELDLIWGVPFFNRSNSNSIWKKNLFYLPEEIELSRQMIRYWTNFVKFGNPNDNQTLPTHWPVYEKTNKSFLNFHMDQLTLDNDFFEERFQFWEFFKYRQQCRPFRWYQTSLLIGIFILTLLLILIYIFYNTQRSRRNIKPVDSTLDHIRTAYQNLPTVVT